MSWVKKVRESKKILDAAAEALAIYELNAAYIQGLIDGNNKLLESTKELINLHRQLMDNMGLDEPEIERTIEAPLQVVTTRGTFPVGSKCPVHDVVHSDKGRWYICLPNDMGYVDVTGWYPAPKKVGHR